MIKAGIVGASGFVGGNILRLLLRHGGVDEIRVFSTSEAGRPVQEFHEGLDSALVLEPVDYEVINGLDVVFLAVPHGAAGEHAARIRTRIVDMTGDHRLVWTYGLPELFADRIREATRVANPGCYPTSAILAVYPILDQVDYVVFDSISGYSGGGKNHGYEVQENVIAYKIANHRHTRELRRVLGPVFSFTPHVANLFRGMMTTAHIRLRASMDRDEIISIFKQFYAGTRTLVQGDVPDVKSVAGTPYCRLGGFEFDENGTLVVVSVIDNLLKGAASQAIENMNLMFGLDPGAFLEEAG